MAELKAGSTAPDFELPAGDGQRYSLKQFRGKKVILYFYPQDDTETCTLQACSFRDHRSEIDAAGAILIGVSPDDSGSHHHFAKKYGLTFPLLCDSDKKVMKAYGVWKMKLMFGRKYKGVIRTTFVIDERGAIKQIFRNVRIKGHVEKIIQTVIS
jgi:peroxiredoxin Q/BCP